MEGAFTAIGDESDGLLVNPASIANLSHQPESRQSTQQLSTTAARLHVGLSDETSITQNLISYAYSRPTIGALGLLWKRLNVGQLYSENYLLVGLSKSYDFGADDIRRISLGGAVKFLNWGHGTHNWGRWFSGGRLAGEESAGSGCWHDFSPISEHSDSPIPPEPKHS